MIAGEASGDLHGANLIKEIKKQDKEAEFRAWGGDLMEAAGAKIVKHYKEHAIMGFTAVIANLPSILQNIKSCKKDIISYNPDVLIPIDYPGFNLKIAKFAKKHNFKVYYYISPKIWAWKKGRVKQVKKYVDKMFTIFPFETEFYGKYNYKVDYVGNPLLDAIAEFSPSERQEFIRKNNLSEKPIIALLPGSRKQEIELLLPEMINTTKDIQDKQIVIAAAPSISKEMYEKNYGKTKNISIVYNQTYDLLAHAETALVTSGTATLETALFNVPQVVCYKTNSLSYFIGSKIVDIEFFSLVNIVAEKEVVKELLQKNITENMKIELNKIMPAKEGRKKMLKEYEEMRRKLGKAGAAKRTAEIIVNSLK